VRTSPSCSVRTESSSMRCWFIASRCWLKSSYSRFSGVFWAVLLLGRAAGAIVDRL
jgi:hypothetical protein